MKTDDLVAAVEREDPVRPFELPSAHSPEARALRERIVLSPAPPRGRGRRLLLIAAAGAVVVAALALLRVVPDEQLGASNAAGALLEQAAAAATAYTDVPEGRYAYSKARTLYAGISTDDPPYTVLTPRLRETWVAADGSGRIREVAGELVFPGDRDRERWAADGSIRMGAGSSTDQALRPHRAEAAGLAGRDPRDLSLRELDRLMNSPAYLPTDPDLLERVVRAYAETRDPPLSSAMFVQLSDLLNDRHGSAELRAAAYRVLARVDGVELGGRVVDPAGRAGTALIAPAGYSDQTRHRLVIDPSTGDVLAEQTVLTRRVDWVDGDPGEAIGSIVYLESGWVDSVDERPSTG